MIALHRLTHPEQVVFVNSDLILTIEATPDTVVTLTNGSRLIVIEKPYELIGLIRGWRGSIIAKAIEAHEAEAEALADVVHLSGSRPEQVDQ